MFSFLKGNKTDLTVTLDRPNGRYLPGETVGVTVEIQPDKDLKLQGAQVKLSGKEEYRYHTVSSTTDSDGSSSETHNYPWGHNEFFADGEDFLGETTLPGGTRQRYTFQLRVPADALPSFTGKIIHVKWQVSVKLARRLAGDLHSEVDLVVQSIAPGLSLQPGEFGASSAPGEADLALILPGLEAVAGQSISGQLRVLPHKNFSSEVRVELVCNEDVPYDQGNQDHKTVPFKVASNTQFAAEQPQTFSFQVVIPSDAAPSGQTPHGSIDWKIKGILNRRLHKDTVVEQISRSIQLRRKVHLEGVDFSVDVTHLPDRRLGLAAAIFVALHHGNEE